MFENIVDEDETVLARCTQDSCEKYRDGLDDAESLSDFMM